MKQVSYEEVLNYLYGGNLFGELTNESLELIEKLIDKEKPPTFDEVVNGWRLIDNDMALQSESEGLLVYVKYDHLMDGSENHDIAIITTDNIIDIDLGAFVFDMNLHNAINLTIRYLESQKGKKNESKD